MDCALSLAADGGVEVLAGRGYRARPGIRVSVYDLPPNCTSWMNIARNHRPLHLLLWQRLQSAGALTADAGQADYHFIPLNSRNNDYERMARWAIPYVQQTWPHWGRDLGSRHLAIHSGDLGRRGFLNDLTVPTRAALNDSIANVTWLTHWGLTRFHKGGHWAASHRPGKDIVIPPLISSSRGIHLSPLNPAAPRPNRTGLLYFAGRVCGDQQPPSPDTGRCDENDPHADFSGGVRQQVFEHHHAREGFTLVPEERESEAVQAMSSHTFCLSVPGAGFDSRAVLAVLLGCVPVTIGDGILQPFEPELPWQDFSVHVPEADIPRLHTLLGAMPLERVQAMQAQLPCMAQHLYYSSSLGAVFGEDGRYDAFETLMEILRVRQEHPGVSPERYREVDERFRAFADCRLGEPRPGVLCTQGGERLRPDTPTCRECHKLSEQHRTGSSFLNAPGGAICCAEPNAAKCARVAAGEPASGAMEAAEPGVGADAGRGPGGGERLR
ncbi:hypothetical protein HYH03_012689 [Edaphochlamys debaryana]|uniref:Exostosin GT47 domain-containing protein n=1 Tax=Edaphochlamys debaryana TaxID=47281 RepID=A0A835XR32_9CHLO|nr:hypothetical protein HYH03_012689 [Edaphochlamys debaryana]|eukprot:KAG2488688.1 hypothetical protein HYH03_012689 [Edaphochlamys debaryana]